MKKNRKSRYWQRLCTLGMCAPHVQDPTPVASNDVRCLLCGLRDACLVAVVVGMWRVPAVSVVDAAVTLCWTADRDTSIHCPPPSSRDGGVTDSSATSSRPSHPMSNNEPIDVPLDGAGNGHTDDKLRRPRQRFDFSSQPMPSDSQPMPSEAVHDYGAHLDASIEVASYHLCLAWRHQLQGADRDVSSSGRSRSHCGSHPSDADSERTFQAPPVVRTSVSSPSHIRSVRLRCMTPVGQVRTCDLLAYASPTTVTLTGHVGRYRAEPGQFIQSHP